MFITTITDSILVRQLLSLSNKQHFIMTITKHVMGVLTEVVAAMDSFFTTNLYHFCQEELQGMFQELKNVAENIKLHTHPHTWRMLDNDYFKVSLRSFGYLLKCSVDRRGDGKSMVEVYGPDAVQARIDFLTEQHEVSKRPVLVRDLLSLYTFEFLLTTEQMQARDALRTSAKAAVAHALTFSGIPAALTDKGARQLFRKMPVPVSDKSGPTSDDAVAQVIESVLADVGRGSVNVIVKDAMPDCAPATSEPPTDTPSSSSDAKHAMPDPSSSKTETKKAKTDKKNSADKQLDKALKAAEKAKKKESVGDPTAKDILSQFFKPSVIA